MATGSLVPNCPIKAVTSDSILQQAAPICAGLGEPGGLLFSPILFFFSVWTQNKICLTCVYDVYSIAG